MDLYSVGDLLVFYSSVLEFDMHGKVSNHTRLRPAKMSEMDGTTYKVNIAWHSDDINSTQVLTLAELLNGNDTGHRVHLSIKQGQVVHQIDQPIKLSDADVKELFESVNLKNNPRVDWFNMLIK